MRPRESEGAIIVCEHDTGAPVTNLTAVTLNSTAITISWSPPPPHLTLMALTTLYITYGFSSSQQRETLQVATSVTSVLFARLEENEEYEFSVFGDYGGGVLGVEVTVTATTHEDSTSLILFTCVFFLFFLLIS